MPKVKPDAALIPELSRDHARGAQISKRLFTSGDISDVYKGKYTGSRACVGELRVSSGSDPNKTAKGDIRCQYYKLCVI